MPSSIITTNNYTSSSSISRTAIDSLQAKYSAFVHGKCKLPSCRYDTSATIDNDACDKNNTCDGVVQQHEDTSNYVDLLQSMTEYFIQHPKRQTPLVNIGYAIRVSCVLYHIERFITFHQLHHHHTHTGNRYNNCNSYNNDNNNVQIIVLGCGLDVTGLWSLSLNSKQKQFRHTNSSDTAPASINLGMHVVEIDLPSICESKVQAIQSINSLLPNQQLTEQVAGNGTLLSSKTKIWQSVPISKANDSTTTGSKYTLICADLQDEVQIQDILISSKFIDPNLPTLILSELVVSYLSMKSCNNLLQQISTLFQQEGSCTLLYEPLGGPSLPITQSTSTRNINDDVDTNSNESDTSSILSTLESYQTSYCNSFNKKLQKGTATSASSSSKQPYDCQQLFHPLGTTTAMVSDRLKQLGFSHINIAPVGVVAAVAASLGSEHTTITTTTELFDEHAALVLHLSSYVVICAYPTNSIQPSDHHHQHWRTIDTDLFRQFLCPWTSLMGLLRYPHAINVTPLSHIDIHDYCVPIWITNIRKVDEKSVRSIFQESYQQYFEKYPSIRKMVKSALRKDLGVADSNNERIETDSIPNEMNNISTIASRYQEQGGDFLVAVQLRFDHDNTKGDGFEVSPIARPSNVVHYHHVLGCIGIRKSTKEERKAYSIPISNIVYCYEINRFSIQEQYRKRGIGTALWNTLLSCILLKCRKEQKYALLQSNNDCDEIGYILYIIATTPSILVSANNFYNKVGFTIQKQEEVGDLTMITYMKTIKL